MPTFNSWFWYEDLFRCFSESLGFEKPDGWDASAHRPTIVLKGSLDPSVVLDRWDGSGWLETFGRFDALVARSFTLTLDGELNVLWRGRDSDQPETVPATLVPPQQKALEAFIDLLEKLFNSMISEPIEAMNDAVYALNNGGSIDVPPALQSVVAAIDRKAPGYEDIPMDGELSVAEYFYDVFVDAICDGIYDAALIEFTLHDGDVFETGGVVVWPKEKTGAFLHKALSHLVGEDPLSAPTDKAA